MFPSPWSEWLFRYSLMSEPHLFLVAKEGARLIAYALGGLERKRIGGWIRLAGHVKNIAVVEDWRRRGVGSMIMSELERRLWALGVEMIYLEVRESNRVAQAMYHERGYKIIKRVIGYYGNEDALIMVNKR